MRRTIALIAIVAGVVIGSKLLLENVLGFSLEPWARAWAADAGWPAAAVVVGLLAVDIFIPVPSSIVMVLSGAAFGVGGVAAGVRRIRSAASGSASSWRAATARRGSRDSSATQAERRRLNDILDDARRRRHRGDARAAVVMETMSIVAGLSRDDAAARS